MLQAESVWLGEAGLVVVTAQSGNPSDAALGGAAPPSGVAEKADGSATPAGTGTGAPAGPNMMILLLPVVVFLIITMWTGSRRDKKERAKRAELMASLKKGDTVQTIGGAIGTVAEVREHEIVVKFEEGRIRFTRSAIQTVVKPGKAPGTIEAKSDSKAEAAAEA